ncbi:MAG: S8 family serine peptidase [Flavobacteriales bacterium]|nr:S8 family serine peptidase [Flavobacteriales bacterium]MDW8432782.1 S8 family serine peptidase [Flavobacteriales bacterium]
MRKLSFFTALAAGLGLFYAPSGHAQTHNDFGSIPGDYIVVIDHRQDPMQVLHILNEKAPVPGHAWRVERVLSEDFRIFLLKHQAGPDQLEVLKKIPGVLLAQRNHQVQLRATPNDPSFATQQWSMNNTGQNGGTPDADVDAVEAWDITTGGWTVQNDTIVVAVIDGGFQISHPDLQANIFRNWGEIPGNGIDDDLNGYVDDVNGWNAYTNSGTLQSDNHGTHVAGIIGAVGNNNTGVAGVNWRVKILPICGSSGSEATVVAAYAYAAKMRRLYNQTSGAKGAYVVATNSSFGVDYGQASNYPVWCAFYDSLGVQGILSAGATANLNINVDTQGDIPTTCPSQFLIGVTNTDRNDNRNNGAAYGSVNVDLGAPGTQIYSTVTGSNYQNLTGTSMATPHVAGAIALMYAAACTQTITESKQTPANVALQMRQALLAGVDVITSMNGFVSSNGRLNVFKALQNVQALPCDTTLPPVASFSASQVSGCPGLTVTFNNTSTGNNVSFLWTFPGGTPATSTASNPTVTYNNLGTYSVTLVATNPYGADTLIMPNYINVNNNSTTTIWEETFENGTLTSQGWTVVNPDGQNTWDIFTVAGNTPGTKAAGVNIFNNQSAAPTVDALISPVLDLSNYTSPVLSFQHAHRRRVQSVRDSLWVSVSPDGGQSWISVLRKGENGQGTFATNSITNSNFVPASGSDWCFIDNTPGCFSVDLTPYQGFSNVKIRFEVQNNGGNNIYIDNVKVTGICSGFLPPTPPTAAFQAAKQEVCAGQTIQFTDQSTGNPTAWSWTFPGGTPSSSTQQNPTVTYTTPGTYDVSLTATNAGGSNTLTLTNYITVHPNPAPPVITQSGTALQSSYATGNQWALNGNSIPGATGSTFTPTASGNYTVTHTDANGCSSTSAPFNFQTAGLEADHAFGSIELFPNPASHTLWLKTEGTLQPETLEIADITGRVVDVRRCTAAFMNLSVEHLSPGPYTLTLKAKGQRFTLRWIKN